MAGAPKNNEKTESMRILDRLARETEPGGGSFVPWTAKAMRDHAAPLADDPRDPIEYWGTRIGRTLGLVIALGLMMWLGVFIVRGG